MVSHPAWKVCRRAEWALCAAVCLPGAAVADAPAPPPSATRAPVIDHGLRPVPAIVAIVDGVSIRAIEIADRSGEEARLQRDVREARARELDIQINSRLLEAEARKRNITTGRLLQDEVVARATEPTEADALAYYNEHKQQFRDPFPSVKAVICDRLRDDRRREAAKTFADRLRATAAVKVFDIPVTPPHSDPDLARVFATVNGESVSSAQVEEALRPMVYQTERRLYQLRNDRLQVKINDMLLQAEATRRARSTSDLLALEIRPKTVTEGAAKAFYEENKAHLAGDFEKLKPQIIKYLEGKGKEEAERKFAERLRAAATIQLFLTKPEPPVFNTAVDDQPTLGSSAAPVTLVIFVDYTSPNCGHALATLTTIVKERPGQLRLVVRDYPLDRHPEAFRAAEAAEAARAQGRYWEYVALLLNHPEALAADRLKEYATQAMLDRSAFEAALDGGRGAGAIRRDQADGDRLQFATLPAVYLNGRPLDDTGDDALKGAVTAALTAAR